MQDYYNVYANDTYMYTYSQIHGNKLINNTMQYPSQIIITRVASFHITCLSI